MPGTLKTLLEKLKRRRKTKAAAPNHARNGVSNELVIADGISNLSISRPSNASPESEPKTKIAFGASCDFEFSFFLDTSPKWPGPEYDRKSLWAPGVFDKARVSKPKSKQRSSKRKLSSEGGQLKVRSRDLPNPKPVREKARRSRPLGYGSSTIPLDSPLHFYNLPGEIRNAIYRLVCVKSEPIVAQIRPILKPKRGPSTTRLPREPAFAWALPKFFMKELLSTFYRENTFVFRRSEMDHLKDVIMTNAETMNQWAPQFDLATSLRQIQLHFTVRPSADARETIIYTFSKRDGASLDVSSNAPGPVADSCTCFDRKYLFALRASLAQEPKASNLLQSASKASLLRQEMLSRDPNMFVISRSLYQPKHLTCEDCGQPNLNGIEDGV